MQLLDMFCWALNSIETYTAEWEKCVWCCDTETTTAFLTLFRISFHLVIMGFKRNWLFLSQLQLHWNLCPHGNRRCCNTEIEYLWKKKTFFHFLLPSNLRLWSDGWMLKLVLQNVELNKAQALHSSPSPFPRARIENVNNEYSGNHHHLLLIRHICCS